jgi:hypothetical protein
MRTDSIKNTLAAAALLASLNALAATTPTDHPFVKRPFTLPPSADLNYTIKARQHGLALNGDATFTWRTADGKYSVLLEAHVPIFGKLVENRSEGAVDDYGLAPVTFYEKRFRKDPTTTTFKRDVKVINFTESDESYPLKGGEQDRVSAEWQLLAVARGAPEKFVPGSEWAFFVAGRRDAEPWIFKVANVENVQTGQGNVSAVHLVKAPPPDAQGQQVDIWLAPSLEWYPVRVRFSDNDGDYVEQTLDKIIKK